MTAPAQQLPPFGRMAVDLGLLTETEVTQALSVKPRERDLAEFLIERCTLTRHHRRIIDEALDVPTPAVPGYRIGRRIALGAKGEVYEAVRASDGRAVAVKILSRDTGVDPAEAGRFVRGGKALARVTHPNIVAALDAGEAGGALYLVMEFVQGHTLARRVLGSGLLPETETVSVARQVAEALDCLQGHGMVHRDVKPDNVILAPDGTVKLCDFGLARLIETGDTVTLAGDVVGTVAFMSPEQIRGDETLDIRSDIYSLGATLYFTVTGRLVFDANNVDAVLDMHLQTPPGDPRLHNPALGEGLALVILACLAKNRAHRYPTPAALRTALDRLA